MWQGKSCNQIFPRGIALCNSRAFDDFIRCVSKDRTTMPKEDPEGSGSETSCFTYSESCNNASEMPPSMCCHVDSRGLGTILRGSRNWAEACCFLRARVAHEALCYCLFVGGAACTTLSWALELLVRLAIWKLKYTFWVACLRTRKCQWKDRKSLLTELSPSFAAVVAQHFSPFMNSWKDS